MQANGFPLSVDEYPIFLSQDTDTATPRTPIPIYYMHTLSAPFCRSLTCVCQRSRRDAARLLGVIAEGTLHLHEAATLKDGERENDRHQNTPAGTAPTVTIKGVPHLVDVPVSCQFYGHSWERTAYPGVKQCYLCGIRGYCTGCTPFPPAGTQPFSCTAHARQGQVQQ